jgi:catechol 2,3-dioxygenase-like lactoylglutathione lyase family enzyme
METTTITKKLDHERDFYGCVLGLREANYHDDSDFYAIVWDEEQGCVREINDGTTRAYAPSKYHRADATDEVRAKARAWYANNANVREAARNRLNRLAAAVRINDEVKVVKGRKIAKGTVGEVFWFGADGFRHGAYRIGLRLADGSRVYTALENVAKVNVVLPTDAEVEREIARNNPY